jgi:DNA mismatch repair ATPase MutL
MDITIHLTPEEEARLKSQARQRGLELTQYARQQLGLNEPDTFTPDAENQTLINLLRSWREEDATDDEEELERRDVELQAFKANINATRTVNAEEPVYLFLI